MPDTSTPKKPPLRDQIMDWVWTGIVVMVISGAAFELGRAYGFKQGVQQMWLAELAILHALAKDDASASDDAHSGGL